MSVTTISKKNMMSIYFHRSGGQILPLTVTAVHENDVGAIQVFLKKPDRIALRFTYCQVWVSLIRAIKGSYWHSSDRMWSVPLTMDSVEALQKVFRGERLVCDPAIEPYFKIAADIEAARHEMRLRNFSHLTIKAYLSSLRGFMEFFQPRHPRELSNQDIRRYLLHLIENKNLASSSVNQAINAMKFLYGEVYRQPLAMDDIPRPKRPKRLPVPLSREELRRLFDAKVNLKHKALLMVAYSGGLRVGEVVRLKPGDIESDRMLIRVRSGKREKDRYTLLGKTALNALREYMYKERGENWLFPGQQNGHHLSKRTAEEIFMDAARTAGINKHVTFHSLRHSFASHLLEDGVDLRVIQELLGHESLKTTEIYLHVAHQRIQQVQSPVDRLNAGGARPNDR
jgi:integrase/recombinase XerD